MPCVLSSVAVESMDNNIAANFLIFSTYSSFLFLKIWRDMAGLVLLCPFYLFYGLLFLVVSELIN